MLQVHPEVGDCGGFLEVNGESTDLKSTSTSKFSTLKAIGRPASLLKGSTAVAIAAGSLGDTSLAVIATRTGTATAADLSWLKCDEDSVAVLESSVAGDGACARVVRSCDGGIAWGIGMAMTS